ncbi:TLC domain-containing protein, partial [Syncephalis plumigaleata]
YRLGRLDVCFIVYMTLALTLFRSCVMRYLLEPLGKHYGIRNLSKLERFKEQGYQCVYYLISWSSGMYIMYNSPYWFDTRHFWINYPHRDYTWHSKTYYLMSLAYTLHLIYVLHVEAKRKDYRAMFAHHIVTALLITCSYVTHFPRIGNAVLCMMDFADIILPLAKCMRYAKFQRICDVTFGVFVLAWIYTRFYLYAQVCYAIYAEAEKYIEPIWDPVRGVFLTRNARVYFLALFAALQMLIIYWFILICRVLWRVVSGANAHDNRSSGSEEEEDEKEME